MSEHEADEHLSEHVRVALARDERVRELDLHVAVTAGKVFLTGAVPTPERRDTVGTVAHELLPDHDIHNDVVVSAILSGGDERS